jgi:histidinol phosphatase-like enzyme
MGGVNSKPNINFFIISLKKYKINFKSNNIQMVHIGDKMTDIKFANNLNYFFKNNNNKSFCEGILYTAFKHYKTGKNELRYPIEKQNKKLLTMGNIERCTYLIRKILKLKEKYKKNDICSDLCL